LKNINQKQIERLFQAEVYRRGLNYYQNKRVRNLDYNEPDETWFAEVFGTRIYDVEIDLSELAQGRIIPNCDCPAFETYHTCKHIVAVMLAMANEQETLQPTKDIVTSRFLDGLLATSGGGSLNVLSDRLPMQVEYTLKVDYQSKIWLEWKTGVEHRYIVRNVREFLDHVLDDEPHFFTKKFTYDTSQHYFLEQDRAIFELLAGFIETGDLFTSQGYYSHQNYDRRSQLIPPLALQSLLEKLQERKVEVEISDDHYTGFEIEEGVVPYGFTVTHDAREQLTLQIDAAKNALFLQEYKLVFADGVFYFPTREQLKMTMQISRMRSNQYKMPISGVNAERFFSEALPVLKQNSKVHIAPEVADEIVEYPLRAKLYLEKREDMIIGNLKYHYGPHEINPFDGIRQEEVIIVRDNELETRIMHLIERSNFHYNGEKLYIKMANDEEVYDFLYTILPQLDEYVELFLTSDIQSLIVETEPIPSTTVSVETGTNLLEIGFDISGVNDDEVNAMIQAVIEKKRFYRLNSGAIVSLENTGFEKMEQLFTELHVGKDDLQNGAVHVPVYRGLQVDELIDTKKYDPSFRKLLHALKHPEEEMYPVPENLNAELRTYQEIGFQWFKALSNYHLGGILADDMGLGKTLQTITYLLSEPSDKPHLVVVPSSVIFNWRNEIHKFAPTMEVAVISGAPDERIDLIKTAQGKQIWITSYGTLRQDKDLYAEQTFQTLILDEAQFIKNYQTKTSKAVREIKALRRFALSGTPIENSIDELWAIFQVVLPGLMPNQRTFRQLEHEKIASLTRPFILRRLKGDVLRELPAKIESVHTSELTKEQKDLYVGYLRELQEMTSASIAEGGFQKSRMKILAGLTRLRQLCCHPSLFIENYAGKSGKLEELLEQVQSLTSSGRRLLIFSQFTSMHQLIMKELGKMGIDYFYLEGQTPAKERVEMSEAFNQGEKEVFLISLRAGGTGLNLTGADTVILYDLWWNPAVEDQAAGRAHRFGQKNVVQVIRFITEGTIEEKIYELQQKKRELIDQVVQPGETMLSSLTEDDVKELLSM
jgi:superfamily II DNA or RNA helicase